MEQILKQRVEGISLDTNSLAQMANSLSLEDKASPAVCDAVDVELAIEEESCTMDPVGDTITRPSYASFLAFACPT